MLGASLGLPVRRYSIHFHLCGDQTNNSVIRKNLILNSKQRCIVIHATFNATIDSNVAYNTSGQSLHHTLPFRTVLWCAVMCCTVLSSNASCNTSGGESHPTVPCCTLLYCNEPSCSVLCPPVPYCTIFVDYCPLLQNCCSRRMLLDGPLLLKVAACQPLLCCTPSRADGREKGGGGKHTLIQAGVMVSLLSWQPDGERL